MAGRPRHRAGTRSANRPGGRACGRAVCIGRRREMAAVESLHCAPETHIPNGRLHTDQPHTKTKRKTELHSLVRKSVGVCYRKDELFSKAENAFTKRLIYHFENWSFLELSLL